ncbi:hypothetical protein H671_1g0379 [Cricetulus griseus]|nr:hypothetical protein H671_1g0379 [Cricetulus griseus]
MTAAPLWVPRDGLRAALTHSRVPAWTPEAREAMDAPTLETPPRRRLGPAVNVIMVSVQVQHSSEGKHINAQFYDSRYLL